MFSCATCVGVTYKFKVYSHAEYVHETICMPIKIILVLLSALMRKNISKMLQCFFSLDFIVFYCWSVIFARHTNAYWILDICCNEKITFPLHKSLISECKSSFKIRLDKIKSRNLFLLPLISISGSIAQAVLREVGALLLLFMSHQLLVENCSWWCHSSFSV